MDHREPHPVEWRWVSALVLLGGALMFFVGLGSNHLANWDEAWYAAVSRTMIRSGSPLALEWNGGQFFDKPPLYYWLTVIAMSVFGENEFAVRFFSALTALGTVFIVWDMARRRYGMLAGLVAATVLTTCVGYVFRVREGNVDALLSFLCTGSLWAFFRAENGSRRWYGLASFMMWGGFLTKGVIGLVPGGMYLFYDTLFRKQSAIRNRWFILGAITGGAVTVIWLFGSYLRYGDPFLSGFVGHQSGKFLSRGTVFEHFSPEPLRYLVSGMKIWTLFLVPSAIWFALKRFRFSDSITILFPLSYLVVLMLAENKSNWFLVPIYPLAAIIIGHAVESSVRILRIRWLLGILALMLPTGLTLLFYSGQMMARDTAYHEAMVATAANFLTPTDATLYLTDYLYPTAVYYSERRVRAVFSDRPDNPDFFILPRTAWPSLVRELPVYIMGTAPEIDTVRSRYFPDLTMITLYSSGERQLVSVVPAGKAGL